MRRLLLLVLSFTIVFLFTIGCSKPKEIRQEIWNTSKDLVVDIDKAMKEEKQVDRYTYNQIQSLIDKTKNSRDFNLTKEEYNLIKSIYQLYYTQNSYIIADKGKYKEEKRKLYNKLYNQLSSLLN